MLPTTISPCINVGDTQPARDFYPRHFGARITFDCGWYVNFEFGQDGPTLQFMQPQSPGMQEFAGGLTYNIRLETIDQVDAKHAEFVELGITIVMPLEDHPWGDRGFCALDPYGVALYVYADIEMSEEYRQYIRVEEAAS